MKRIYFIHIAKTGGISLEENLLAATSMTPCPAYYWEDLLKLENLSEHNLFLGHLQYFCKDFIGDAFTFTILRDPIERAMSGWEHIHRDPNHPARAHLEEAPDIRSALQHRRLRRHISNSMTWFLGPRPQYEKFKTKEAAIRHAIHDFPDEVMLDHAKEALDQLDFIGFTETLNSDTVRLFNILNLETRPEEELEVKNSNPTKTSKKYVEELDQETIELLREANEIDFKLYEYAQQLAGKKGWR